MTPVLSLRETLLAEAALLAGERDDLDPTGAAYAQKSLELDEVLAAVFVLGPVDV